MTCRALSLRRVRAGVFAMLALVLLACAPAVAATITVDNGEDPTSPQSGVCSLREAIRASETHSAIGGCSAGSGTDTIVLAVPKVTLTIKGAGEDQDETGDLDLTGSITIEGQASGTVIDGSQLGDRVFDVQSGANASLSNLTVTGGRPSAGGLDVFGEDGGGIRNAGTLQLKGVTVTKNATANGVPFLHLGTDSGNGGGIASSGALTMSDCTVSENATGDAGQGSEALSQGEVGGTAGAGGGIYAAGPTTIADSTIFGNRTGSGGAGGLGEGRAGKGDATFGGDGEDGYGGEGGQGGAGGGIAVGYSPSASITGSLIVKTTTGSGGAGGTGVGGDGSSGEYAGHGGYATGGRGGSGGGGGGIYIAVDAKTEVVSDTIAENEVSYGGEGGSAYGGDSGSGARGYGGYGEGGDGGYGGSGAGGDGGVSNSLFLADTVVDNVISYEYVRGGEGHGGKAPPGEPEGASIGGEPGPIGDGGGLDRAEVLSSIIAFNTRDQCVGLTPVLGKLGANLSFPDGGCEGEVAEPMLEPLADNGGPTKTFALAATSPAVGEVPIAAECPAVDQRGVARPQGGACDAGAYERAAPTVHTEGATVEGTTAKLAGTVNPNQRQSAVHFAWGAQGQPLRATSEQTLAASNKASPVSVTVSGLTPGVTYSYTLTATNADGTANGEQRSFLVPVPPGAPGSGAAGPGGLGSSPPNLLAAPALVPVLSRLGLKPAAFRPATRSHRKHRGTTVSWSDSQAATSTFAVQRKVPGVRRGKACVAPPRRRTKDKPGRRCSRYRTLRGSFEHSDRVGSNTLAWNGALAGKALSPGSYRLQVSAALNGLAGAIISHPFEIQG
jgi:hypothetical protein